MHACQQDGGSYASRSWVWIKLKYSFLYFHAAIMLRYHYVYCLSCHIDVGYSTRKPTCLWVGVRAEVVKTILSRAACVADICHYSLWRLDGFFWNIDPPGNVPVANFDAFHCSVSRMQSRSQEFFSWGVQMLVAGTEAPSGSRGEAPPPVRGRGAQKLKPVLFCT